MDIAVSQGIRAQLKRSARRRTIGIKVQKGRVLVSAPMQAPMSAIQAFVRHKASWVERHLARQQQQIASHQETNLCAGDCLLFLGDRYTLRAGDDSLSAPVLDAQSSSLLLPPSVFALTVESRKAFLAQWYTSQAIDYLELKVAEYASLMALWPKSIKVRHYKTRWGSCNSRGELQFNWLLMMAPASVIDYVVVHELAHLQHFNHSNAFWRLVASVIPQHLDRRAWLKQQSVLVW